MLIVAGWVALLVVGVGAWVGLCYLVGKVPPPRDPWGDDYLFRIRSAEEESDA